MGTNASAGPQHLPMLWRALLRGALAALLALLALTTLVPGAEAVWPRFIVFAGDLLPAPVEINDIDEVRVVNAGIAERSPVDRAELEGRPYLTMQLFWGVRWEQSTTEERAVLTISGANYSGSSRFYPAVGEHPPLVFVSIEAGSGVVAGEVTFLEEVRQVAPDALAILEAHGVPTAIGVTETSRAGPPPWLVAGIAATALAVFAALGVRRLASNVSL